MNNNNASSALLVTCFGIGYSKYFPGTLGSILGVILYFATFKAFSFHGENFGYLSYFLFNLINFIILTLSLWSVQESERYLAFLKYSRDDPKEIIIDEVVGQMLSLNLIFYFIANSNGEFKPIYMLNIEIHYWLTVLSFISFRFFDIVKFFPVSYFDNQSGAKYIILDDLAAAFMSFAGVYLMSVLLLKYFL